MVDSEEVLIRLFMIGNILEMFIAICNTSFNKLKQSNYNDTYYFLCNL